MMIEIIIIIIIIMLIMWQYKIMFTQNYKKL